MSDEEEHNGQDTAGQQPAPATPPIKKPPRRSPTTGHRRRKQEAKRSHSSPREKLEASSEDDETVRRNSEEEKPKKTVRRRNKGKIEKPEEIVRSVEEPEEEEEAAVIVPTEEEKYELLQQGCTTTTVEPVSWWSRWIPYWSRINVQDEETSKNKTEDTIKDDADLNSEFAALVSQTERKILAELESQIITDLEDQPEKKDLLEEEPSTPPPTWSSWSQFFHDTKLKFKKYKEEYPQEVETLKKLRNRCISELVIMMIFCGLGALVFKFVEGAFESFYKCGVKRVKRDFIDELWRGSHHLREDEWKSKARRKLMEFENQLHEAFDAGMTTYSGRKSWSFINAVIYCLTVITTIGVLLN